MLLEASRKRSRGRRTRLLLFGTRKTDPWWLDNEKAFLGSSGGQGFDGVVGGTSTLYDVNIHKGAIRFSDEWIGDPILTPSVQEDLSSQFCAFARVWRRRRLARGFGLFASVNILCESFSACSFDLVDLAFDFSVHPGAAAQDKRSS